MQGLLRPAWLHVMLMVKRRAAKRGTSRYEAIPACESRTWLNYNRTITIKNSHAIIATWGISKGCGYTSGPKVLIIDHLWTRIWYLQSHIYFQNLEGRRNRPGKADQRWTLNTTHYVWVLLYKPKTFPSKSYLFRICFSFPARPGADNQHGDTKRHKHKETSLKFGFFFDITYWLSKRHNNLWAVLNLAWNLNHVSEGVRLTKEPPQ